MPQVFLIVVDGLGIGAQEDAELYGDENADTLGHVSRITKCSLPNFEALGLGNIRELASVPASPAPAASYGKMREVSAGKDSTTGHWELAGIHLKDPFPTYPDGFPEDVINMFCGKTGVPGVLCNAPVSGTEVIEKFGREHIQAGKPIVYTSADSVFQVACHTDTTDVDTLYGWCEMTRKEIMKGRHAVGRVIARPFHGTPGRFERISELRHDYSRNPPPNLLSLLNDHHIPVISVGKVIDLFAEQGFTRYVRTRDNTDGIVQLSKIMDQGGENRFVFANLIDTDQIYGHRQDPEGYAKALQEIDAALPALIGRLGENDLMIVTGDHGNDPADESTDHTREFVPLLVVKGRGKQGNNLGVRETFSDVSATVLELFAAPVHTAGTSFLHLL